MAILDQSKQISLILKNKKLKMYKLHIYYSQKLKLDKYTTHSKTKFYIF